MCVEAWEEKAAAPVVKSDTKLCFSPLKVLKIF